MTPVRVVCNNTLTAALHGTGNRVYIRHTKNAEERLKEAHKVLGLANKYRVEVEAAFNQMAAKSVSKDLVDLYLSNLFDYKDENGQLVEKSKRTKESILDIFDSSVGGQDMSTCRGTMFGLYNATVFYEDNVANFKDNSSRLYTTWFGNSKSFRMNAFDKALQLI
jgi:phage/plasmid-like protein (TIGR03299 family)